MKIDFKAFVFILSILLNVTANKLHIAVNDLKAKGLDQSSVDLITDRLCGELIKTGSFRVMERSEMKNVLEEQNFQRSGICDEQSCVVEMGRVLGVERMVTGNVGKVGGMHTLSLKMVDVKTGEILISVNEDCTCQLEEVLAKSTIAIAEKLEMAIQTERFGRVKINTKPQGARVYINKKDKGATPYTGEMLIPGKYTFKLTKDNYIPLNHSFFVTKGKTVELSFHLKRTKEYKDSVVAVKKKAKRKKRIIRQIILGTITCGLFAGGFGTDYYYLNNDIEEKDRLVEQYNNATGNFDYYKNEIDKIQVDIDKKKLYRNVLYGFSAAGAVGFTVSFFF